MLRQEGRRLLPVVVVRLARPRQLARAGPRLGAGTRALLRGQRAGTKPREGRSLQPSPWRGEVGDKPVC